MEQKMKTPQSVLASLQRTCARMERCRSDIMRSLYRSGLDREHWDGIIASLVEDRYVDERRYAESFAREKSSLQKWSRMRIRLGLKAKGIPEALIEEAIGSCTDAATETSNLEGILAARKVKTKETDPYALRRKLFSYAAGKGYDIDEINETLDRICRN